MKKLETMNTGELFAELNNANERSNYFATLAAVGDTKQHHDAVRVYRAIARAARGVLDARGISVRCVKGVYLPAELFNN